MQLPLYGDNARSTQRNKIGVEYYNPPPAFNLYSLRVLAGAREVNDKTEEIKQDWAQNAEPIPSATPLLYSIIVSSPPMNPSAELVCMCLFTNHLSFRFGGKTSVCGCVCV